MKLAHRQKFSGKARTNYRRDQQARWWMEESVDEFLDPHEQDLAGAHIAPVIRGASFLAEAGDSDSSGAYAGLEGPVMEAEISLRNNTATDSTPAQPLARAHREESSVQVVSRPAPGCDLLPKAPSADEFSWFKFAAGCLLGTAAALGVLMVLSSLLS